MAEHFIDKVDLEARRRAAKIIHEKFTRVLEDILEGKAPVLEIPKRTLANVRFDPEKGILIMGEDKIRRDFLNMGEARKFMQTLLMAAIIYQALVENEYPTIRDLYYRGKHTILYRDLRGRRREENTWEAQSESDAAIRDVEVFTGLLREDMLILSKEKGKVVGRMTIRSGGDIIDLSKMGHGAYAIESTPDLIEFLDVDAEFVLVVEKDAVFQQLHRIKFWDKYRGLLVTGAGQPDRATRRFVRRLNEELNLPIYILTDSIPGDEIVIVKDTGTGMIRVGPVGELMEQYFTPGVEWERVDAPIMVPSWNPVTGRVEWTPIGYAYRHYVEDKILVIDTDDRGRIKVTSGHSLFVFREGRIQVVPARDIKRGDYLIAVERLPSTGSPDGIPGFGLMKTGVKATQSSLLQLLPSKTTRVDHFTEGKNEKIPERLYNSSRLVKLSFLKDLFERSGSIDDEGNVVLNMRGDSTAKQATILLLLLGVDVSVRYSGGGVEIVVPAEPSRTPLDLYYHVSGRRLEEIIGEAGKYTIDAIHNGIHDSLISVEAKARRATGMIKGHGSIMHYRTNPIMPGVYYDIAHSDLKIVRVEDVRVEEYSGYVYDYAVPGTNSFVGGHGILLHNSDPYGWYIYSVFKVGSIQLSYESERLATPKARFLGVSMSDVFGYRGKKPYLSERERKNYIIKAKDIDIKRAKELMRYSWFRQKGWRRELRLFLAKKAKLEIEAMASKGLRFLADTYIPEKIQTGDWIE